jgi:hypothetical protein
MQAKWSRPGRILAALALTAVLVGCHQTKISDIRKDPSKYVGDEITIAGKVTQSGDDFKQGSFEVDDGTGKICVVTDKINLPPQGSQIVVSGLVEPGVHLGSNSLPPVLQEMTRYQKPGGD